MTVSRDWIDRIKVMLGFADAILVEVMHVPLTESGGCFYIKPIDSKNGPLVPLSLFDFEKVESSQKLDWLLFRLKFAVDLLKQTKKAPPSDTLPLDSGKKATI